MKRALWVLVVLTACRNWEVFSASYGDGGSGSGGSGGGGASSVGGGSGGAAGGSMGGGAGGAGGGGAAGGAVDAGMDDPGACRGQKASSCPAGTLLCDGFNGGLPGQWTLSADGGTVTTFDGCFYRGTRALRSSLFAAGANVPAWAQLREGWGARSELYVRAFVRMPSVSGPAVRIMELEQEPPGDGSARLVVSAGQLSATASAGAMPGSTASFPPARWNCVEWRLVIGAAGTQTVYLDDVEVITGPLDVQNLVRFSLGARLSPHAAATAATEVQYDEVVVDDQRIGCTN